jgi:REP element-mobilizing transposase RayT
VPQYNSEKHHRRSIRLKDYDYTQAGAYFVTVCTYARACLFGDVVEDAVNLNECGQIVYTEWLKSAEIRPEIELDIFVIISNHLHGIVVITGVGAHGRAPLLNHASLYRQPKSLGSFIAGYKSTVTKQINLNRHTPGLPVWQRNYYEHIIRNDRALIAIREYINQNPLRWHLDLYNPSATERDPKARDLWNLLKST